MTIECDRVGLFSDIKVSYVNEPSKDYTVSVTPTLDGHHITYTDAFGTFQPPAPVPLILEGPTLPEFSESQTFEEAKSAYFDYEDKWYARSQGLKPVYDDTVWVGLAIIALATFAVIAFH